MPDLPLALFAGILTIAAPCTLPVLPILLGASIGRRAGTRPAFIAAGFVASFAFVALALNAIATAALAWLGQFFPEGRRLGL
jgi:cytochrome c-type biogenesis protein